MKSPSRLLSACKTALADGLRRSSPGVNLSDNGYVNAPTENLLQGLHFGDFRSDFDQGSGNELVGKFLAAHSSSALGANSFGPFKTDPGALRLLGQDGFHRLDFERKCPNGLRRGTPPNLDLLVEGERSIVAVESKCLEYLSPKPAAFSPAYSAEIIDDRRGTRWFAEMGRLLQEPRTYRWLDATQLVKHAYGLMRTFSNHSAPVTLLYLYWEPMNPGVSPIFAEHRDEIDQFATAVAGERLGFASMSYLELWSGWATSASLPWLPIHVERLRERYMVAVHC